jgi:hypothetical protein
VEAGARAGPMPATAAALEAFTSLPNDPTGIDTFERYLWQAKLAVLNWLATLGPNGPIAVVAEMVEDLVVIETDLFRFAQLKTRDRGSWSAAKICGKDHAVSKLVASYQAAKAAGLLELSQFEVWLEGPPSADAPTSAFFANPAKADADIRKKIRAMGLKGAELTEFLSRLRIVCQQPSRQFIDAVVMKAIGATWPHLQFQQQADLYEQLLKLATAAQAASEPPTVVRAALSVGRGDPADSEGWAPIQSQALLREHLRSICPPLGSASNAELLQRAAAGETTLLELKLVRAGAGPETVANAISARADAEVAATLAVSGGRIDEGDVEALDKRILSMADSVAALGRLGGPSALAPAEHVFHNLMSRPADVSSTDTASVFEGDHRLVVGHLCGLSDQCRFGWGRP